MRKVFLFSLLGLLSGALAQAAPHPAPGFGFEENKAQWPAAARYRALLPTGAVWLRATGFTYDWVSEADLRRQDAARQAASPQPGLTNTTDPAQPPAAMRLHGHAVQVDFVGATPGALLQAETPAAAYTNYFIGTDSTRWASRVRSYAQVTYRGLYPGIDVRTHGSAAGQFEYDVVLAPGADPAQVRLRYRGAAGLRLRTDGALTITTSVGEVREQRPVAWQVGADGQRQAVPVRFRLAGEELTFEMPAGYDRKRELVIDPVVQASTYTGLTALPQGTAYDAAGNIYVAASTFVFGAVFPISPGAYFLPTASGIGISKFNASGTLLLFSTVLGGAGSGQGDFLRLLKTDAAGNVFMVAENYRNSFPMLPTSYSSSIGTGKQILAKLNASGTALLGATYIGGPGGVSRQGVRALAIGANGSVYVAGYTNNPNFPTTPGTYRPTYGAAGTNPLNTEGFIAHFDSGLTTLLWSTFMATSTPVFSSVNALCTNAAGLVYFAANLNTDFPVPATAAAPVFAGSVLGCLSATGSQLLYATYLPTAMPGQTVTLNNLVFDQAGNVAVMGKGYNARMVPTPGAFSYFGSFPSGTVAGQVFIAKFSTNLRTLLQLSAPAFGTFPLPASLSSTFQIDDCGNLLFLLALENQPTPAAFAPVITPIAGGLAQGLTRGYYLGALSADGRQLLFGTFYGSGGAGFYNSDPGAIDRQGRFYLVFTPLGSLQPNYQVLPGAYHTAPLTPAVGTNLSEMVAVIIDPQLANSQPRALLLPPGPVCLGQPVQLTSNSTGAGRVRWDFGDGSPRDSANVNPQHTYPRPGTYRVRLLVRPVPGSCARPDTTSALVRVGAPAVRALLPRVYRCPGQPAVTLDAGNPGSTYQWNTGATTQTIAVAQPGTYVVAIRTPCGRIDTARVLVPAPPRLVRDSLACAGVVTLRVADPDPAATYAWSTGATTPSLAVTEPGRYTLVVNVGGCRFELAAVAAPAGALPTVPNVFTPGPADAFNATFAVPGLPPGSRLRVYSRWGRLVYEAADYRNTWDAAGLAAGIYYYLLENPRFCQASTYKGWVEVIR